MAVTDQGCLLVVTIFAIILPFTWQEDVMFGESNEDFDFDGLPGVQHEFKVEIPPGREECFYQNIKQGAQLHVSFQVLRGADRNVDVVLKKPNQRVLSSHLWTHEGTFDEDIHEGGIYAICIDNSFSRFSSKLVYVYFVTYVIAEWQSFAEEMAKFDVSVENFTSSLAAVDKSVNQMRKLQAMSRQYVVSDWYLITGNNKYVQNLSIVMCVIVIVSGGFQTYFVRRLFNTPNVTPTAKPRA